MKEFRLKVARSRICGRGVFADSVIPARRKIGELGGELISLYEARRRARRSRCVMIVEFGDGTALDASRGGTVLRHVNHSCAPNTYMRSARGRVEFYALRQIKSGEELTCDYGETHHDGKRRCRCRTPNCRVWI
jgi:SET domain-containing protein